MEAKSEEVSDDIVVSGYFEPASVLRQLRKKVVRPKDNTLEDSETARRNEDERSKCNILSNDFAVVVWCIRCLELKVVVMKTVEILIGDMSRTQFSLLARLRVLCSERFMFGPWYYSYDLV